MLPRAVPHRPLRLVRQGRARKVLVAVLEELQILVLVAMGGCVLAVVIEVHGQLVTQLHTYESKASITRMQVKRLAYEAFPAWCAAHPDRECPNTLDEIAAYAEHGHPYDAYTGRLEFACAAGRIIVFSLGQDGVAHTADDIWSDR